jgi:hypothetical protein
MLNCEVMPLGSETRGHLDKGGNASSATLKAVVAWELIVIRYWNLLDAGDLGLGRPLRPAPRLQRGYAVRRALGVDFDAAITEVPHPTSQP